jgi:hypothetical protein
VVAQPVFHGTTDESTALVNAIARNCGCQYALTGARSTTCAPHQMLIEDQRALDGLVFMRRRVEHLRRGEFGAK